MYCGGKSLFLPQSSCLIILESLFQYVWRSIHGVMVSADETGAVVMDVGHWSSRFGYGGEDFPKADFPTVRVLKLLFGCYV